MFWPKMPKTPCFKHLAAGVLGWTRSERDDLPPPFTIASKSTLFGMDSESLLGGSKLLLCEASPCAFLLDLLFANGAVAQHFLNEPLALGLRIGLFTFPRRG